MGREQEINSEKEKELEMKKENEMENSTIFETFKVNIYDISTI